MGAAGSTHAVPRTIARCLREWTRFGPNTLRGIDGPLLTHSRNLSNNEEFLALLLLKLGKALLEDEAGGVGVNLDVHHGDLDAHLVVGAVGGGARVLLVLVLGAAAGVENLNDGGGDVAAHNLGGEGVGCEGHGNTGSGSASEGLAAAASQRHLQARRGSVTMTPMCAKLLQDIN